MVTSKMLKEDPVSMLKTSWKESKFNILAKNKLYRIPEEVVRAYRVETNSTDSLTLSVF